MAIQKLRSNAIISVDGWLHGTPPKAPEMRFDLWLDRTSHETRDHRYQGIFHGPSQKPEFDREKKVWDVIFPKGLEEELRDPGGQHATRYQFEIDRSVFKKNSPNRDIAVNGFIAVRRDTNPFEQLWTHSDKVRYPLLGTSFRGAVASHIGHPYSAHGRVISQIMQTGENFGITGTMLGLKYDMPVHFSTVLSDPKYNVSHMISDAEAAKNTIGTFVTTIDDPEIGGKTYSGSYAISKELPEEEIFARKAEIFTALHHRLLLPPWAEKWLRRTSRLAHTARPFKRIIQPAMMLAIGYGAYQAIKNTWQKEGKFGTRTRGALSDGVIDIADAALNPLPDFGYAASYLKPMARKALGAA